MEISYTCIEIPTGSGNNGTTSRDKLSILNKTSVIHIKNTDNNCFWYALVPQVYKAHPKYSEIVKGRPIREKLAKELCTLCHWDWGKPVSFDAIPLFENVFNANIYIMSMTEIPLLGDTVNIYI